MKKALYATEFLITFVFFALPSLLTAQRSASAVEIKFTFYNFAALLYFSVLLYANQKLFCQNYNTQNKVNPLLKRAYALTSFGLLAAISVFFQVILFLLQKKSGAVEHSTLIAPHGIISWLSFTAAVVSGAFCEETCYRFALVDFGKEIYSFGKKGIPWEIIACVIFALGHRYQGFLGILNAFCCGIALRVLVIKTKSIFLAIAVHAAYNFAAALLYIVIFYQAAR